MLKSVIQVLTNHNFPTRMSVQIKLYYMSNCLQLCIYVWGYLHPYTSDRYNFSTHTPIMLIRLDITLISMTQWVLLLVSLVFQWQYHLFLAPKLMFKLSVNSSQSYCVGVQPSLLKVLYWPWQNLSFVSSAKTVV